MSNFVQLQRVIRRMSRSKTPLFSQLVLSSWRSWTFKRYDEQSQWLWRNYDDICQDVTASNYIVTYVDDAGITSTNRSWQVCSGRLTTKNWWRLNPKLTLQRQILNQLWVCVHVLFEDILNLIGTADLKLRVVGFLVLNPTHRWCHCGKSHIIELAAAYRWFRMLT